ncbi:thioredoxin domain-containing protein [bacterium]|nr:thioredoxin domain-containing protein [bacterium]
MTHGKTGHTNRLAKEKSPYLLQHAHNPVDWYPWGDEAFETARKLDKPIFLSIGYSTCHWCHVMAHESFEDEAVAKLMNDAFICIKVDREERPDVDTVYMTVCQMMTGSGGWPLTIIMTPDKKPFFAGTYIPKTTRFGRTGMLDLIPKLTEAWKTKRADILKSANQITEALRRPRPAVGDVDLDENILKLGANQLGGRYDPDFGGFGRAPKFPTPHNLLFLLRQWRRTGDGKLLAMVENTLQWMRRGGVYDHVGFGFHRYATDPVWLLPHFEKMLYDQALLTLAYTEAHQATGKPEYADTAREILTYVLRDMTSPQGGFYSAEDADSEGEEGKFYLWANDELPAILGKDDAALAIRVYHFEKQGNFIEQGSQERTGTNIIHLRTPLAEAAKEEKMAEAALRGRLEAIRRKLFPVREKRIHPHKDDKILTDWNGLMIAAFARAGRVLGDPRYTAAAARSADFVLKQLRRKDGRLLHSYRDRSASTAPSHVDDYAFLVWGLLELYETTFDVRRLRVARDLTRDMLEHFWDEEKGGFYFTADDGEKLLVRPRELYDGAIPSGNSVALSNLLRLARITADTGLEEKASELTKAFGAQVARSPIAFTQFLVGLDFAVGPSYEIVVVGEPGKADTEAMLRALRSKYVPSKVVLLRQPGDAPPIAALAPFTKPMTLRDGKATAYVCRGYACERPTTDPAVMLKALGVE